MYKSLLGLIVLSMFCFTQELSSQESSKKQLKKLHEHKSIITQKEKELLKIEVADINERLEKNEITDEEARKLKEGVAKKRALNIQNKINILENQIEVYERNKTDSIAFDDKYSIHYDWREVYTWLKNKTAKSINDGTTSPRKIKYDRRTYSSFVLADGLNYVSTNGSLKDFKSSSFSSAIFFELGWQWRTRVFKKSNFLRFNYGLSLQINPIGLRDNMSYVLNEGKAILKEFEFSLVRPAIFKRTNLVVPIYFEFGPSKVNKTKNSIRYSIKKKVRFGIGAFAGVNLDTKQKLEFFENGVRTKVKQKNAFDTNKEIYGLSAYAGFGGLLLYAKYDLNPIFNDSEVKYRNLSIGIRTDL